MAYLPLSACFRTPFLCSLEKGILMYTVFHIHRAPKFQLSAHLNGKKLLSSQFVTYYLQKLGIK